MTDKSTQRAIKSVLSLINPCSVECGKVRVGGGHDGGYVMANDFTDNKIAYSIGVGPQVDWDVDMANRGLDIYQYDHTVDFVPAENEKFRYFKFGIGPDDISDIDLKTLEKMLEDNGHSQEKNMILKMDVEHAEWDAFLTMDVEILKRFDQIVMELHGFYELENPSFRIKAGIVLEKLATHHRCIHVHANNYSTFSVIAGLAFPQTMEVTYCRKEKFNFIDKSDFFPTEDDKPCNPDAPDLYLGQFQFR
jgi:hypothetical protein